MGASSQSLAVTLVSLASISHGAGRRAPTGILGRVHRGEQARSHAHERAEGGADDAAKCGHGPSQLGDGAPFSEWTAEWTITDGSATVYLGPDLARPEVFETPTF